MYAKETENTTTLYGSDYEINELHNKIRHASHVC